MLRYFFFPKSWFDGFALIILCKFFI
jgi:hypothetical protein